MGHQLTVLYEIVKVTSGVNHTKRVVELGGFVALVFDVEKETFEVVVRN